MAYFEGFLTTLAACGSTRCFPDSHWSSRFSGRHGLVMNHLDGLHDRVELIECCVGLGLMVSAFVLAVWLLPL
jgi:hypothetical protein